MAIAPAHIIGVMEECAQKKVKTIIIVSTGFGETGEEGRQIEKNILAIARENDMRIMGPNCMGMFSADVSLNASIIDLDPGPLSLVLQSGNFGIDINFNARQRNLGYSNWATIGKNSEGKDKVLMGAERRSLSMTEEERANTAYHEAGHALVQQMAEDAEPLHKVTIIPRGMYLGATMSLPAKERYTEGLISYIGEDWSMETDAKVKDGFLSGKFKRINSLIGEDARIAGHSFWHYIGQTYGRKVLKNIVYMAIVNRNIESGFSYILGKDLEMITQGWKDFYKVLSLIT